MDKRWQPIVISSILILCLSLFITKNNDDDIISIINTQSMWEIYDYNLNNIRTNMDEITIENENFYWWELKDFNIDDTEYKDTLNLLVSDIRMCYLALTDDGTFYTDSNLIQKYRYENKITKGDLEMLISSINNYNCLQRFEKYLSLSLSNDDKIAQELLKKINSINQIYKNNIFVNDESRYNELLSFKIAETTILSDLSSWIKLEYYKLK